MREIEHVWRSYNITQNLTQECFGIALQCCSKLHITLKSVFIDILLDIYVLNHKILGVLCLYSCPIIFLYSDEIPVAIVDSIVDEPLVQSAQEGPDLVIPPPEEIARGRSRPRGRLREQEVRRKAKVQLLQGSQQLLTLHTRAMMTQILEINCRHLCLVLVHLVCISMCLS